MPGPMCLKRTCLCSRQVRLGRGEPEGTRPGDSSKIFSLVNKFTYSFSQQIFRLDARVPNSAKLDMVPAFTEIEVSSWEGILTAV